MNPFPLNFLPEPCFCLSWARAKCDKEAIGPAQLVSFQMCRGSSSSNSNLHESLTGREIHNKRKQLHNFLSSYFQYDDLSIQLPVTHLSLSIVCSGHLFRAAFCLICFDVVLSLTQTLIHMHVLFYILFYVANFARSGCTRPSISANKTQRNHFKRTHAGQTKYFLEHASGPSLLITDSSKEISK